MSDKGPGWAGRPGDFVRQDVEMDTRMSVADRVVWVMALVTIALIIFG
jgi:hypothetical protein